MVYIYFLIGFVLLFFGGKYLVEGSVSVAKDLKISPLIIGIILVGFGTSVPELITCIKAVLMGSSEIAIGNVIGSNIANILLVLSTGAIICTIPMSKKGFRRDTSILMLSSALLTFFCFLGFINLYAGSLFIIILFSYMFYCYKTGGVDEEDIPVISKSVYLSFSIAILGILGVLIGANFLVNSAIEIARELGVSESLIALTAVSIGTSLPELATIISASVKKHSDIALGNIIGSNIFNTLGILGVTSFVRKIDISPYILDFDIWVMNLAVIAMTLLIVHNKQLTRNKGLFLLALYILYITAITIRG